MIDCTTSGAVRFYDSPSYLLRGSGLILAVRYSRSGNLMATVSTNGERGLLEIWPLPNVARFHEPVARRLFDHVIVDAAWVSEDAVAVCGNGLLAVYSVNDLATTSKSASDGALPALQGTQNLKEEYMHPKANQWDRVRYDAVTDMLAANSAQENSLLLLTKQDGVWREGPAIEHQSKLHQTLNALAFEPIPESAETRSDMVRRLALAYDSGSVLVYSVSSQDCELIHHLSIGPQEPALALSWHGTRLAAASDEAIKAWDLNDPSHTIISWQAAPAKWYQGSDHHLPSDEDAQTTPSLSWDVEGKRLAFTVGRKVSIRPISNLMSDY